MARKVYDVSPRKDDKWQVKGRGNERASSVHETKQEAVEAGVDLAKNVQPSQLVIHKENGRFQTERTYKKDPFPPRG